MIQTNAYPTISLHDCRAVQAEINSTDLTFCFEDGFWITPENEHNPHDKILKTGSSTLCVRKKEYDEADVYIFRETLFFRRLLRTVRKKITIEQLAEQLNSGKWQLEFIGEHYGYNSVIYSCWIWSDRKPYHMECQIEITYSKLVYSWDEILEDREW